MEEPIRPQRIAFGLIFLALAFTLLLLLFPRFGNNPLNLKLERGSWQEYAGRAIYFSFTFFIGTWIYQKYLNRSELKIGFKFGIVILPIYFALLTLALINFT